jgi:Protein of unknown function (DUF1549)/Protein of unknown function (DUF1553)
MKSRLGYVLVILSVLNFVPSSVLNASEPIPQEDTSLETLVKIQIYPSQVFLGGQRSTQQLVVEGYFADGFAEDLTSQVSLFSDSPAIVRVEGRVAHPMASGTTSITARVGALSASASVTARNIEETPEWSFRNHVIPVLTKSGCNSGACHGASAGKNGFKLTLRGYDPELDYQVLTREAVSRRISKIEPGRSLFLLKPTLYVPHGGGRRFGADSLEYRVLSEWIAEGTKPPLVSDRRIDHINMEPRRARLHAGAKQQMLVTAHFNDGFVEDVTRWVRFESTNAGVASVNEHGLVEMKGSGEASITGMYLSKVDVGTLVVPYPNKVDENVFSRAPRNNYVDPLILDKLQALNIEPSGVSGDSEFLRRASLDATGRLPTASEAEEFLASKAPDKRSKLVEQLLNSRAYVDYWAYKWSDLLQVSSGRPENPRLTRSAILSYYGWIRDSVAQNKPWDKMVRELLVATGNSRDNGALNFYQLHRDPIRLTENTTVAFLGLRLTCARCHNHPLEKWTQVDYYKMANLFARVSQKNGDAAGEVVVFNSVSGDINHPRLNKPLPPTPLDGEPMSLDSPKDRREHLAAWLTSPRNRSFSRTIVNRVWANFMGRGLVDPVDDIRSTNPASNESLMDALVADFVNHGYDIKYFCSVIMNSAAYQRAWQTNPTNANDDRYYSHYLVKRLPAEVILDAASQVTGVPTPFKDYPVGIRALQLPDTGVESYFLDAFGRPPRLSTCECERDPQPSLRQALQVINGDTINKKIAAEDGSINQALRNGMSDEALIKQLFLSAFSRNPTEKERKEILEAVRAATASGEPEAQKEAFHDVAWAIMTGREFLFNH